MTKIKLELSRKTLFQKEETKKKAPTNYRDVDDLVRRKSEKGFYEPRENR